MTAMTTASTTRETRVGWRRWVPWWAPDGPYDDPITTLQPLAAALVSLAGVLTVRPLGWSGWPLVGTVLLTLNVIMTFVRSIPDRVMPAPIRLPSACVGAVLAALIFGYDPTSAGQAFGYFMAVHIGVRFEPVLAAVLVTGEAGIAGVVIAVRHQPGGVPWWTVVGLALSVLFGMLRRTRLLTLQATRDLVEQTRRAAASEIRAQQLADRAELARNIHDVLAHSLSGVNMQLSMADALLEAGQVDDGKLAVQKARAMVVSGLTEARRAVQALRAESLDLVPTLRAMAEPDADEQVEIRGPGTTVTAAQAQTVVRTAQESLTNARRHAPGAPVRIVLDRQPLSLTLTVSNGPAARPAGSGVGGGMGLVGMRERAALAGARVTAGPVVDGEFAGGWRVVLDVPAVGEREIAATTVGDRDAARTPADDGAAQSAEADRGAVPIGRPDAGVDEREP
jgi:signal transduction histidine kinase